MPKELLEGPAKWRQGNLYHLLDSLRMAPDRTEDARELQLAYCAEYADPICATGLPGDKPTTEEYIELGIWFFPWTRLIKATAESIAALRAAVHGGRTAAPVASANTVEVMMKGLQMGRSSSGTVRTVSNQAELQNLYGQLTAGGTRIAPGNYPGIITELSDGTKVMLRGTSKSGGPTIDIMLPSGVSFKVHIQ